MTTLILNLGLGLFGSLCIATLGSYLLQHVLAVPDALKPEIAAALPDVDVFVAGLGTGVTLMGVGRYLKQHNPSMQVVAAEPDQGQGARGCHDRDDREDSDQPAPSHGHLLNLPADVRARCPAEENSYRSLTPR